MMEKAIITSKHNSYLKFSRFFCEIASNQLLCRINLTQYSVLLTRLYGCVRKRDASLLKCYWYLVSNYDLKQYAIHFFFKDQLFNF